MQIFLCRSKTRGGRVTAKELHYQGSITIDADILRAANLFPGEMVYALNMHNGARVYTYIIEGEAGSHAMCPNGPAARFFEIGDEIIILAIASMTPQEATGFHMKVVELDAGNSIISCR